MAIIGIALGTSTVLRLAGKGLPRFGRCGSSDLFVRLRIRVPERLSTEERKLYERLQALARERAHDMS